MDKIKVVFITLAIGNYNGTFFNELNEQIKDWADIYIIYYSGYAKFIPGNLDKNIHLVPAEGANIFDNKFSKSIITSPDSIIGYFFKYKHLDKILKNISPDIIQTYLYFMPYSWQASKYCTKNHIPLLTYEEIQKEPSFIVTKMLNRIGLLWLKKTMLKKISYIVCATKQGMEFQKKHLTNEDKIIHIPWPVDEEKLINLKRQQNKTAKLRLIMVARMVPYKDHALVIAAMTILKKENIPFHLTLIGSGPLENEIKESIKSNKLEKDITIHLTVPSENMKDYYLKSDLLILASMNESYGLVVPEAMACGCGVIISDTSGTKFFVENNKNGYIFKTHSVEDLVNKIKLAKNQTKRFGEYSRNLIKTKYSKKTITKRFIDLLQAALKKNKKTK
jgi:glycosyltransferase involved in cell wall biosynthesis